MPQSDVLVIGAGPTGLVLALWLTKLGVKLRIIDGEAVIAASSTAPCFVDLMNCDNLWSKNRQIRLLERARSFSPFNGF